MNTEGRTIRLPLNRPEYVTVPEAFISALAWKLFDAPDLLETEGKKRVGLYFRGSTPKGKNVEFRSTSPEGEQLSELAAALSHAGVKAEESGSELARAVLNSVLGIRVERSDIQPASPITPALALLQNPRGLLRKENPPDIADILESMYSFGLPDAKPSLGVAERWRCAAERRMTVDSLLSSLDLAIDDSIVRRVELKREAPNGTAHFQGLFCGTPFEWFTTSWDRLTSDAWVEALPARVWVDWATTVLRLGFGAGFLWESSWYLAVAREVVRTEPIRTWVEVQSTIGEVIPWASSRAGTAARDIAPKLIRRAYQSEIVRHSFDVWNKTQENEDPSFEATIQRMREDKGLREELLGALTSQRRVNSGTNLWEAIKYALMTRDASGRNPDYYGLLKSRGRFLTVAPGTEWVAVVASLACGVPDGVTDVGHVLSSLRTLGMRPELRDLISLLERAGMARGSADADSGVIVKSAF